MWSLFDSTSRRLNHYGEGEREGGGGGFTKMAPPPSPKA